MKYVETRTVEIDQLDAWPGNPRRHDTATLTESAVRNGQYRSVVARRLAGGGLQLLAGHGTVTAFAATGATSVRVEVIDADDTEARRIVLVDNRANDLAGYDDTALAALLADAAATVDGLAGTGFDAAAVDALLAGLTPPPAPLGDPDDAPPLPAAAPVTQAGDVWDLGPHRLVCGDAKDPATLDVLLDGDDPIGALLTDPPYGMNLDADYSKMPSGNAKSQMNRQATRYRQVIGDDEPFDAAPLRARFAAVKEQFWFGADYYRRTLSPDDRDGSWLIWDKRNEGQDNVIGSGFETIWSAQPHQRRMLRHYWCGAFGAPEARNRMHPTQKPTALLVDILTRWAPVDCLVLDPFAGSGSTLVAAHLCGRRARCVELDPAYCDVIAARWQQVSGVVPVRAGAPVDFGTGGGGGVG